MWDENQNQKILTSTHNMKQGTLHSSGDTGLWHMARVNPVGESCIFYTAREVCIGSLL